ncbi:hypothetical protein [Hymenobacter jejuensis]|uniref:Uncharacterized protein n=1 Tax=Hymenobacter jejuensis TaxID=2502781 RepID=A0A5B7ZV16_9BACT|nr:hypothetical protein [Hymenobacter jejuensis]QDA58971.1 hypothetical protein FHG12_02120 [Hymenobacter jejuensis]
MGVTYELAGVVGVAIRRFAGGALAYPFSAATLMGKDKKKKAKHKNQPAQDLLDRAAVSIKKFRRITKQIAKLSPGQKLVGGLALVATGLAYLAQQQAYTRSSAAASAEAAEENSASSLLSESKTDPDNARGSLGRPKKHREIGPA